MLLVDCWRHRSPLRCDLSIVLHQVWLWTQGRHLGGGGAEGGNTGWTSGEGGDQKAVTYGWPLGGEDQEEDFQAVLEHASGRNHIACSLQALGGVNAASSMLPAL